MIQGILQNDRLKSAILYATMVTNEWSHLGDEWSEESSKDDRLKYRLSN